MPAPTFDQQAQSSTTTITFTLNPPAGATILLFVSYTGTGSISAVSGCGAGWAFLVDGGSAYGTMKVWLGMNCSGAAKIITITPAGTLTTVTVKAISLAGAHPTQAVHSTYAMGGTYPVENATVGPTPGANCMAVAAYVLDTVSTTTPTTGIGGMSGAGTKFTNGSVYINSGWHTLASQSDTPNFTVQWASNSTPPGVPVILIRGQGSVLVPRTVAMVGDSAMTAEGYNAPGVGMTLEARVFAAASPNGAPIALLSGMRALQWHDPLNDVGAGSLELALADPSASVANLTKWNLVRCFLGAFDVFQFWIETPAYVIAAPTGDSGEHVTIAGRGLEAYLDRAIVWLGGYAATGSAGLIMSDLLTTARARGAISLIQWDFNAAADSAGVPWSGTFAVIVMSLTEGTSLLAVLNQLRGLGVIARMRRDFTLQMWQTYGRNLTSAVILREGQAIAGPVAWTLAQSRAVSALIVRGAPNYAVAVIDGATTLPDRFEGYLKGPESSDTATLTASASTEIAARKLSASPIQVPIYHGQDVGQVEPYRHFDVGDTVMLDVPGQLQAGELVAAINVQSADAQVYSVALDLSAVQPDVVIDLVNAVKELRAPS